MSREGYLIRHESTKESEVLYFVLRDGRMQYFTRREGLYLGELALTGCRLKVRAVSVSEGNHCPNSFVIKAQKVQLVEGRYRNIGLMESLLLSAPSAGEKMAWGSALNSWQRHYWKDAEKGKEHLSVDELADLYREQVRVLENVLREAQSTYMQGIKNRYSRFKSASSSAIALGVAKKTNSNVVISLPDPSISMAHSLQQSAY